MTKTELQLLDLTRSMLAEESNKKLQEAKFQKTAYTEQLEKVISEITALKNRFY